MSKVTVFKFDISQVYDQNIINSIIGNYLNNNGFSYNNEEKCYMVGTPSKDEANSKVSQAVGETVANVLVNGQSFVNANVQNHPCFECKIENNQLIIKAYTINAFSGIKAYIHVTINTCMEGREYYNNLKSNLFNQLQQYHIQLISTETEKINDKRTLKLFKTALIMSLPVAAFFGLMALISYLSHN